MNFIGRIYRADRLENLILTGVLSGKIQQGRRRMNIMIKFVRMNWNGEDTTVQEDAGSEGVEDYSR